MLRMPQAVIIVILLLGSLLLNAVQEKFEFHNQDITLEFENIKIKDIKFYKGESIIVKYAKKDDVIVEQVEDVLSVSSGLGARITLKLPVENTYNFVKDDAVCMFTENMMEITTGDEVVRFTENKLEVSEGDKTKVEIGEDGIIVDDDERVVIGSEGIFVDGEEDTELSGFWGKLLGSVIQSIARASISFAGKRPEKIAKYIINDEEHNNTYTYSLGLDLEENYKYETEIEREFYLNSGSSLDLHNINGSVNIEEWDKDHLFVKIRKRSRSSQEELDKVVINFEEGQQFSIVTEHLEKNPKVAVTFDLFIPDGMLIRRVVTSNGAIELDGCSGDAELMTSNGSIEVEEHEGDLILRSSNGRIEAEDISGATDASTSNGRIDLEKITGAVSATTSNGSVEISSCPLITDIHTSNARIEAEILQINSDLDIRTSNGKIILYISSNVDSEVEASTNNGRITSDHPRLKIDTSSKEYIKGKLGSGGKNLMLRTSNSNIQIYILEELL